MNEGQIKAAKHNFELAAEDFGFDFVSPFKLTDELEAFGYIANCGSKNGTVVCLTLAPDFKTDKRVVDWCKEMECFCSFLNIEPLAGAYNRAYFREMLRDWGKC